MLGKLFKPHWQHPKAQSRLKAVAQLNLADSAQQDILVRLAKGDSDSQVRCAATSRLTDLALLQHLTRNDADKQVQAAAGERLLSLLAGTSSDAPCRDNRLRSIRLLNDKPLLTRLLDACQDSACLLAVLERLDDQQAYARFALAGTDLTVREQAAQHLTDTTLLRQLARDGRDKKVVQFARDALKQQQQLQQQQQTQQQQLDELLTQLQQHASRSLDPLFEARLIHLQEQWQLFAPLADSEQTQQAEQQLARAQQTLAAQQQAIQQQAAQAQAAMSRQQCLNALDDFFTHLDENSWQSANALATAFASLDASWQDACAQFPASAEESTRYQQAAQRWQTLKQLHTAFEELHQQPDDATTADALQPLLAAWPNTIALPALASELQARLPQPITSAGKPGSQHQRPRHGGLLHQLRQSLKARQLKEANRAWQRLQQALSKHPDAASEQQAQSLKPQLDELRDWHAFAADPKKQNLCERMELLVATPLSHPEEQANAIQALHDEWHELMSANQEADQSLWDRFKQASDAAYDHCRDYFRELDAKRADNLAKRHAIYQQLNGFLAQQDWDKADGNALWQIRCQAPKDWQAASPVRFTDARELGQQFHQLLKQFDAQLDTLSQAHLPQLTQLLDNFIALAALDDVAQAARQAKPLQRAWRDAGWVHPQQFRKLDRQKRQLCDAIFSKQQAEQQQEQAKQQQLAQALKQELDQLKDLLDAGSSPEQLDAALTQLHQQPEPSAAPALAQQKQALLKRARHTRQQQSRQQHWQGWQQLLESAPVIDASAALRQLCVALEVSAACPSPDAAREERLAWQVQQMAQAMKSERPDAQAACTKLLEKDRALIEAGLDDDSRRRLLLVVGSLVAGTVNN